jgi:hypothetical protein
MLPGDFQQLVDEREVGNACRHNSRRLGGVIFLVVDQLLPDCFAGGLVLNFGAAMHKTFRRSFRGDAIRTQ